jgi:3-dehydroquinate synthase
MNIVDVDLDARSYSIFIDSNLLTDEDFLRDRVRSKQVMIVSNETIAPFYLAPLERAFRDRNLVKTILSDGEEFKTLDSLEVIITNLLEHRFDRSCTLVALGAGYAAASYQRGIDFVQIPTTLLAQVDSSVGGKTAVNHPLGKNMIGAFHQPTSVIADTSSLRSLPERELRSGVAEIIKYGLIGDYDFFVWLEVHMEDLLGLDEQTIAHAVERSCRNKAEVVAKDELESGVRALLNLGHTFGHGIENVLGYGRWLHGEAVACGMCMAADLSNRMGLIKDQDLSRVVSLVERAGLPTKPPANLDAGSLLSAMQVDKKNRDGRIRLVLMRAIGDCFVTDDYPNDEFQLVIRSVQNI